MNAFQMRQAMDIAHNLGRLDALLTSTLAERDKFRSHSVALNSALWRMAEYLGEAHKTSTEHHVDDINGLIRRFFEKIEGERK